MIVKQGQVRADQVYSCSVRDVHTRSYRYLATGKTHYLGSGIVHSSEKNMKCDYYTELLHRCV